MVNREAFRPVPNTQPPAAWIGGKRSLAPRLVKMIEAMPHQTYAEPFVGMGGVFFRRRQAPRTEVINDRSGDVVNLFRILQRHYPQFMDTLKFQITSRREFERLKACDPATLTDLERAARFIYLQKLAFGGKVAGQTFGVQHNGSARFNLTRLAPLLEDVHERLSGVVIENLDCLAFINRYDRPGVLFYLDPPYFGCEDDYGKALFGRDQFEVLAGRLKTLQGRFILSINDRPEIREIFVGFPVEGAELTYSVSGGKGTEARELIFVSSSVVF
ncbi:DNA adenine methylase [Agrobacterium vitis]|uniref:site-specific DNA-methyltransferase (adenine-specific) n=1 Tax=Agrobacterium vitis TaxID=373 RepID=A0A368NFW8_AGRVI|nr:DNA adenine methylase [Agrobacterium vitis]KAA3512593.1 DNA adenine methylase [Agrobacterium vitis]KAA3525961.1 DNA adenine methylase [Agrobacterium vitis]MUZ99086.1 DNA adenine methylase [Agrobacterium vitis]MVA31642.1 DNA adenine methylase [Agrobacterium vitis]NOJ33746.1 DNA adenine methylase [Agrobacterium vitis]